jgi:hypothetical protein
MKKIEINRFTKNHKNEQRDKADTVFLKLYAKRRGRYKSWDSIDCKTYPLDIENKQKLIINK